MSFSRYKGGPRAFPAFMIFTPTVFVVSTSVVSMLGYRDLSLILGFVSLVASAVSITDCWLYGMGALVRTVGHDRICHELSYLGHVREPRGGISIYSPSQPLSPFLALVVYKVNAAFFSKNRSQGRFVPKRDNESKNIDRAISDYMTNEYTYLATRLERKFYKSRLVSTNAVTALPLAAYVFMELSSGVKKEELDIEKIKFFYTNNYSLENAYLLREYNGSELESFSDSPHSWVIRALVGEQEKVVKVA